MPSIGRRRWASKCAETFRHFSRAHGISFFLETEFPSADEFPLPELPRRPGRDNKRAYACKTFLAWKYLKKGFDRVAIVDDTCVIRAGTPNFFELVPFGSCGYTRTSFEHAEESFQVIEKFRSEHALEPIEFRPTLYMNSGFLVYDRTMQEALRPEEILFAKDLLFARFPHQTLTYYLLQRGKIPQFELPKVFNTMPAFSLSAEARKELSDIGPHFQAEVFVYHLSAFYRHRAKLLGDLADRFLSDWRESSGPLD